MNQLAKDPTLRPLGIKIVAILMILFGFAEIVTGVTHNFFGISTTLGAIFTFLAAGIGSLYMLGGLFILTMRKRAAALALICLTFVVVGRVALVAAGFFPINSFKQTFAIVAGTAIAIIFAIISHLNGGPLRELSVAIVKKIISKNWAARVPRITSASARTLL
jgi:hypothetical protein